MLERKSDIAGDIDDGTTDVGWSASSLICKRPCEGRGDPLTYLLLGGERSASTSQLQTRSCWPWTYHIRRDCEVNL